MKYTHTVREVSLKRIFMGAVVAGMAGAVLAIFAARILQTASGLKFVELSPVTIALAAMVSNLLGAFVYFLFVRRAKRPNLLYAITALVVATLDTVNVSVHPVHPGFGTIADPLHYVVAIVSAILVPRLSMKKTTAKKEFVAG